MTLKQSKEMAQKACHALEDKKAKDVRILDISEVSVLADYFLIASGSNRNQVQAMVDNVEEELRKAGFSPKQVEGYNTAMATLSSMFLMRKIDCFTIWNAFGETAV